MDVINLLLQELRVSQLTCEFTVVGQQQHTGGVAVEASDGINTFGTSALNEVHDGLAVLGIVGSGDIILRLVEQDIDLFLDLHQLIVELHFVRTLDLGAELCNDNAIDADYASLDEGVGLTT